MLKSIQTDSPKTRPTEHGSYDYLPGRSGNGLILLGDHAGAALPEKYGNLGLVPEQFKRHIAYDIGVREVVSRLAELLGAPAMLGKYSRLLIDLNRGADDPTLIMKLSDGAVVPGNLDIGREEKTHRIENYYQPYHDGVDQLLDGCECAQTLPILISIHSFTPVWKGVERPWHASLLWDRDDRLVRPLLDRLGEEDGLVIGDNVPYSGELEGDTLNQHGTKRGVAHALIEIRQDLVAGNDGQQQWAERLARIIGGIMEDEKIKAMLET